MIFKKKLHQHEVTVKIIESCLNVLRVTPVLLKDNRYLFYFGIFKFIYFLAPLMAYFILMLLLRIDIMLYFIT